MEKKGKEEVDWECFREDSNLLKYACLEHPMDRGAWQATVHRITKGQNQLSEHTQSPELLPHGTQQTLSECLLSCKTPSPPYDTHMIRLS